MNDLDSIRRQQTQALGTLCRELVPANAFYASKLREAGLDLETMTLEDFTAQMPFTTRAEWTHDQIENPPFGTNLTYPVSRYIRFCRTSGSIPATREHISEHWHGARVFDHHGMTEVGPVTYECPAEPGVLHVMEDAFYPEVFDDELILTTLRRPGSPLLRYRTGDLVSAERRSPCACGTAELSPLGGILGRKDDMAVIRGVNVFPSAIEEIVRSVNGIEEYRVELYSRNDQAQMRVIIEGSGGDTACRDLERRFEQAMFLRIPVTLAAPGSLPRYEMKAKRWVKLPNDGGSAS